MPKAAKLSTASYPDFYDKNSDQLSECRLCWVYKPLKEFVRSYEHRNKCKVCHKSRVYEWRENHPKETKQIASRQTSLNQQRIRDRKNKPCAVCGGTFHFCQMDFDHIDRSTKFNNISKLSYDRLEVEFSKCQLVCANCHRNRTQVSSRSVGLGNDRCLHPDVIEIPIYEHSEVRRCAKCREDKNALNFTQLKSGRHHSYCRTCLREVNRKNSTRKVGRASKEFVEKFKESHPCDDCGGFFRYWQMDFDHKSDKVGNINKLQTRSLESVKREITKCDLVCVNCHRLRTYVRNQQMGSDQVKDPELSRLALKLSGKR